MKVTASGYQEWRYKDEKSSTITVAPKDTKELSVELKAVSARKP
jgi:hypothetical protein